MTVRYYPLLLSALILFMLNACSTSSTVPSRVPVVEQEPPAPVEPFIDSNRMAKIQQDPSMRSLPEVIELSQSMIGYQPEVALEIIRSLESLSSSQLTSMVAGQQYDPEFTEWLELALQARTVVINGSAMKPAALDWANYHFGHAVTQRNFTDLVELYRKQFTTPSQVAILLPTHGGLAAAARAIRDGILSAYLEKPGDSVIRFYSSGENSESAFSAYLQAIHDGATQIIGPLRVESTRALASVENLNVPILLLNEATHEDTLKSGQSAMVNSLTLSQSEEAIAIANKALEKGQKHAIVIVPDSAWGKRIETAFTTVFANGDGHISATAHFDTTTSDHSVVLTQLLKIDESKQRKADLQSRIGVPLTFEPHRRDDFDFIFMAASPEEGRELKPLLRFHDTGDVPVYAMGRVFSGRVARASDQDLNGVLFPATPWQLGTTDTTALSLDSVRDGAFGNLYALGQDAWHVLPWLALMQKDPELWFPGETGALRLREDGQLHRQAAWAQFSAGRPIPYQWPDS